MRHHLRLVALLFVVAAAWTAWGAPAAPPVREEVPQAVRELISKKMQRHGATMARLTTAVLMLDDDAVGALTDQLAAEPRFARPLSNDATEINASIPTQFFALQDRLYERVGVLAAATRRHDSEAMAAAYGRLSESCVQCHVQYLRPLATRAQ